MKNSVNNVSIIFYLLIIGWVIALIMYGQKKNRTKLNQFHLRQSLGIHILSIGVYLACIIISYVPVLGGLTCNILYIVIIAMLFWGILGAMSGKENKTPFIGGLFQSFLKNIG